MANTYVYATAYGANGLVQRGFPDQVNIGYMAFSFDPNGNPVQRFRRFEAVVENSGKPIDSAVHDGFGILWADVNRQTGGDYVELDPIGPRGQLGAYTDQETRPGPTYTGLTLTGSSYYDASTTRFLTRGSSGVNEYAASKSGGGGFFSLRTLGGALAGIAGGILTLGNPLGIAGGGNAGQCRQTATNPRHNVPGRTG